MLWKMANHYVKGELLRIHIKNYEVMEGRFHSMTKDMSHITLRQVKSETEQSEKCFHYYRPEILTIVRVREQVEPTYVKISPKDFGDIIKMSKKYIYIDQVDHTFLEAMEDLSYCSYIAVSADGASIGRECKMPFVVVSTPQQIYIFDIQVLQYQGFDAGLKKILESESPKKIVHDCRNLSGCLFHKYSVKLNAVFDTQVGDLILTKNKTGRLPQYVKTLAESLNSYLGLKPTIIKEELDLMQCTERPLAPATKEALAKNISFLHKLSEVIRDQLKLPFVRGAELFVESLRSQDNYRASELRGQQTQIPEEFKSVTE